MFKNMKQKNEHFLFTHQFTYLFITQYLLGSLLLEM